MSGIITPHDHLWYEVYSSRAQEIFCSADNCPTPFLKKGEVGFDEGLKSAQAWTKKIMRGKMYLEAVDP